MKRYCLTLDLKDNEELIKEYEQYHLQIWPEIEKSIKSSGIRNMQIYRLHTRMFMIIEAEDTFSFSQKAATDMANPKVQEWENLMSKYQQALPQAKAGEKWLLMDKIFEI
ncbi:MAG TPA: L-rhamnose mutarotase [Arachidicoccus soli]|nr:L-rhamnose mutarotase [Arachidicoccus soli]